MGQRYKFMILKILLLSLVFNISGNNLFSIADTKNISKTHDNVTLALKWYHQFQFAGYYAAIEKGFYAEEGLDVTLSIPENNIFPVESVISGKAEYGVSSADLLKERVSGKPIVVIGVVFQHSPIVLLSRKDKDLKYLSDYTGKTIMAGNDDLPEIKAMFLKEGINPDKINFVKHTHNIADIINNVVDASVDYISNEPNRLRLAGVEPRIIRPVDYGIDFYADAIFTTEKEAKYNPKRVEAFARASFKGWKYALDNIEEMIDYIYELPGVKESNITKDHLRYEAEQIYKLIQPKLIDIGHINPARWEHIASIYASFNLIPENYNFDGFLFTPDSHNQFLKKAVPYIIFTVILVIVCFLLILLWNYRLRKEVKKQVNLLLKGEEFKKRIFDDAPNPIVIMDAENYTYIDCNKQALLSVGIKTKEEFRGKSPVDFSPQFQYDGKDSASKAEEYINIAKQKGSVTFEWKYIASEGRLMDSEVYLQLFKVDGKEYLQFSMIDITQKKRAEKNLYDIIKHNPISMQIVDKKGHTLMVNEAFKKLFNTLPPDNYSVFQDTQLQINNFSDYVNRAIAGEVVYFPEFCFNPNIVRSDLPDIQIWLKMIIFPLFDELGKIEKYVLMHEDITQRINLLNEIREKERIYATLIDNLPGFSYRCKNDTSWTMDFISAGCFEVTGYTAEEFINNKTKPFASVIESQWIDFLINKWSECLKLKIPMEAEYTILNKNNEIRWVWERGRGVFDENNNLLCLEGFITDITDKKNIEKDLKNALNRNTALLNANPDLMFTFNKEYRITDYHPKERKADYYIDPELILRKPLEDFMPSNLVEMSKRNINKVLDTHTTCFDNYELIINSELKYFEARYVLVDEEHVLSIVRDITKRKLAEIEKEKLQQQLSQSQKMESIGRLAGGVAHDFNNMLGVIIGYTDIILTKIEKDSPFYPKLLEIQKAADKSSNLTRQLLTFARKQEVNPKILNICETVQGMYNMLSRLIGEDIQLDLNLPDEKLITKIDPSQIDQILANLCVNARDAIKEKGKITIELSKVSFSSEQCKANQELKEGAYIKLIVSDNGCGIEKEMLSVIFDPFFTTKDVGEGTGLGLSTVYGIVKQNKGFINVYSEVGYGTSFKIYIPEYLDEFSPSEKTVVKNSNTSKTETILLVEDEETLLLMTKDMLEILGYNVIPANSPIEALKICEEYNKKIHLLITDVIMPEINGKELSEKIKRLYSDIKILFMSGYTANVIAHHGVLKKDVNFIQKPFSIQALNEVVERILNEA